MLKILLEPTIIISMLSLLIATIGIFQTNHQIKLSNKHQLLDKRIDVYIVIADLIATSKRIEPLLKNMKSPENVQNLWKDYITLTSSRYFSTIQRIDFNSNNSNYQLTIMEKLDDLNVIKQKLKFIFPKKEVIVLEKFIDSFMNLIIGYMYLFESAFNKTAVSEMWKEVSKKVNLSTLYDDLEKSYDNILREKIIIKIEKIINIQH